MLNHIALLGRLTDNPVLRSVGAGISCANFTLAVNRDFKNKDTGDYETDFLDIVAWRGTADFVSKYFTKGQLVVVEGRVETSSYTDRENVRRRKWQVIANQVHFAEGKRDGGNNYATGFNPPPSGPSSNQQNGYGQGGAGYQNNNQSGYQNQGGYQAPNAGGGYQVPNNGGGYQVPDQGGYQVPDQGGYQVPDQGGYQVPDQGGFQTPPQAADNAPSNGDSFRTLTPEEERKDLPF